MGFRNYHFLHKQRLSSCKMMLQLFVVLSLFAVTAGSPYAKVDGLVVGDKIGFTMTYSSQTSRFGLNIEDAAGNYHFRLAFRQATDPTGSGPVLVMNSKEGVWGGETRAPWPTLEEGGEYTVLIECQDDKFVASLNGQTIEGVEFPYRYDLADAAALHLWGGVASNDDSASIFWNTFSIPIRQHFPDPAEEEAMTDEVAGSKL